LAVPEKILRFILPPFGEKILAKLIEVVNRFT